MAKDPEWQASLDNFRQKLAITPGIISESARAAFTATDVPQWPNDRKVFTFGQLDVDQMILACREGLCPWWMPFTGRVFTADLDGLKKIQRAFEADPGKSEKPNLSAAMTWIVYPNALCDGYSNTISPQVIRHLLGSGADANYDNGKWLEKALRNLDADGIKPFLDYGAASGTVLRVMDDLQKNQKFAQLGKIQDALAHCAFVKVDADTLLEAKYVPDARGCSVFKTLFNFRSRRVHEIYETGNGAQAVMNGMNFADYDAEALKYAQEKLMQLGGKPRSLEDRLDKPARPLAKGLGRG